MKSLKNGKKIVISFLVLTTLSGVVFVNSRMSANAEIATKPSFKVSIDSVSPNPAIIGEDITVKGTITPQPFETEVPAKEIVMVLDTSGSMNESVKLETTTICKLEGVRYCIVHKKTGSHNKNGKEHDWIDNYCTTHEKSETHYSTTNSTRIKELKKAAKAFVNKMKDVPNLKISIVAYSSLATINPNGKNGDIYVKSIDSRSSHKVPNYISVGSSFLDVKDSRLPSMIDELEPLGGTNTGEGLRRAQYMLKNGDKNANKTIILMSDGLPTFYSVNKDDKNFYTEITKDNPPRFAGPGSGADTSSKNYAVTIGNTIKDTVNNVFSIGYGLGGDTSTENKIMKEMHNSMGGKDENFFASDDGAIDKVFEQIAEKILSTYALSNINMNPNLGSDFTLSVGGNTVRIDNVNYKTDGIVNNGRVKYAADPIGFEFIISATENSQIGIHELFKDATITFPWKDEYINIEVPSVSIEIQDNDLLKIKAELKSDKIVETIPGELVEVTYNITAEEFTFKDSGNKKPKDIAVLIDVSKGEELSQIKSPIIERLINNNISDQVKYSFITYSNEVSVLNSLTKNTNDNRNDMEKIVNDISNSSSTEKNIGRAISKAVEVLNDLNQGATEDSDKYIVFIGSGTQKYDENDEAVSIVRGKDYNVISLSVKGKETSLKTLHTAVLGKQEECFVTASSNDEISNKMNTVLEKIDNSGNYKTYERDVQLTFELGEFFRHVVDGEVKQDDKIIINLPTVRFNNIGNDIYRAESIEPIAFTVTTIIENYGDLQFKKGTMQYRNLINKEVNPILEIPLIKLTQPIKEVKHGIEHTSENGEVNLIEDVVTIAENMNINITAGAKLSSSDVNVELLIDKNIDVYNKDNVSDVKMYKVVDGKLQELVFNVVKSGTTETQNKYKFTISEEISGQTEVVIKYAVKMNSDSIGKTYINNVIFGNIDKPLNLKGASLPNMF